MLLPIAETAVAALFGGVGLWQRSRILSQPWFGGGTMWDTTARLHSWPWPYKFAAISNMPAFLAGMLLPSPMNATTQGQAEAIQHAPILAFAGLLWYWVGCRLDRRWRGTGTATVLVGTRAPWILLLLFTAVCLTGASLPMGYIGYVPYGVLVWLATSITIIKMTRRRDARP